jgi:hypothetical protein
LLICWHLEGKVWVLGGGGLEEPGEGQQLVLQLETGIIVKNQRVKLWSPVDGGFVIEGTQQHGHDWICHRLMLQNLEVGPRCCLFNLAEDGVSVCFTIWCGVPKRQIQCFKIMLSMVSGVPLARLVSWTYGHSSGIR